MQRFFFAGLIWILTVVALPVRSEGVTVFAAASLRGALDEVAASFTVATGQQVAVSYAGSSVLARQIDLGAPADIYLSANSAWMDWLETRGAVITGSRRDLLGNRLVLASSYKIDTIDLSPANALRQSALVDALSEGRLAVALVDAVPAGIYARQALTGLALWETMRPQIIQTDNVRAALALAALGEARLAVVYATDVLAEPRVSSVAVFPQDSHDPILYPAARLSDTQAARAFMDYLTGPAARDIFARHGFLAVPPA